MEGRLSVRIQRLKQARSYCLERSAQVKEEIARCHEEALVLDSRIGSRHDEFEEGRIRHQRRFLRRRIHELRAELERLGREARDVNDELVILLQETEDLDVRSSEVDYSADTQEEYERNGSLAALPRLVVDNS